MSTISEPSCIDELKTRFSAISGKKISTIAEKYNISIPQSLHNTKGWIGQLIELSLGATAGNKAIPDFPSLGIELKTIPLNQHLQPSESTYVCTAPVNANNAIYWENSNVYKKLRHVLWVPVEGTTTQPIAERRIGTPFLWQPTTAQMQILKQDWEELTELLYFGGGENLSAKHGRYLQIRPKAANSKVLINTINQAGEPAQTVPKGFYLRPIFTKLILKQEFFARGNHVE